MTNEQEFSLEERVRLIAERYLTASDRTLSSHTLSRNSTKEILAEIHKENVILPKDADPYDSGYRFGHDQGTEFYNGLRFEYKLLVTSNEELKAKYAKLKERFERMGLKQ